MRDSVNRVQQQGQQKQRILSNWHPVISLQHGLNKVRGVQLVVFLVLLMMLAACGSSFNGSSQSQPWGYVWTNAQQIATLTWNEQPPGQLSGQYSGISYVTVSSPASSPDSFGAAYRGTHAGQKISITIGAGALSEHMTGTQTSNGSSLTLTFLSSTTGRAVSQTWVAVNERQQSNLVQAFTDYQAVQEWFAVVKQERANEDNWQDPNINSLASTQTALQAQQGQLTQMQQAQPNTQTRCTLAAAYRPLDVSWFTLPFPASNDELLSVVAHFQQAWQVAERTTVPHISNLALPWLLLPQAERTAMAPAFALAQRIQAAYTSDAQIMQQDQQQSHALDAQVTLLSQGCPPMPA